ncbi:hypothetical protein PMAYCL1PPCAC_13301, partial [Pristionchus mayeri]
HYLFPHAVVDHKIYFFGGLSEHPDYGAVLDTINDNLQTIPNIPLKALLMTTGVIDGRIYVAGGYNKKISLASLHAYNA